MNTDELYMHRCVQLALNGKPLAYPNPLVGAVIVADGRIIGEGYHARYGEAHAEVQAFVTVKAKDEHLLPTATLYVSLEPCAHKGKTPPCADLIIRKGIRRVVVGSQDPFPLVNGGGIHKLKAAGIQVAIGVLSDECARLNAPFFTLHTRHRPYITLKWAESSDGFIDGIRTPSSPAARLSTARTQLLVHRLRAEHDAILIGRRTLEMDNPSLTTRHWPGKSPQRIVLNSSSLPLSKLLEELHEQGVQTLLVEGGAHTHQTFIDANLWDEIRVEYSSAILHEGIPAATLPTHAQLAGVSQEYYKWGNHRYLRLRK